MAITVTLDSPNDGEGSHGTVVIPGVIAQGDFIFSATDDGSGIVLANVASWNFMVNGVQFAQHTTGLTDFPHTFTIQAGVGASFNWSIEGWNVGDIKIAESEVRTVTMAGGPPPKPVNPSPADDAISITLYPTLSWDAG